MTKEHVIRKLKELSKAYPNELFMMGALDVIADWLENEVDVVPKGKSMEIVIDNSTEKGFSFDGTGDDVRVKEYEVKEKGELKGKGRVKIEENSQHISFPSSSVPEISIYEDMKKANKEVRNTRYDKFIHKYLPIIKLNYLCTEMVKDKFTIKTEEYGTVDYFPKANKLLIRRENNWVKPGLQWIIKHLLGNVD